MQNDKNCQIEKIAFLQVGSLLLAFSLYSLVAHSTNFVQLYYHYSEERGRDDMRQCSVLRNSVFCTSVILELFNNVIVIGLAFVYGFVVNNSSVFGYFRIRLILSVGPLWVLCVLSVLCNCLISQCALNSGLFLTSARCTLQGASLSLIRYIVLTSASVFRLICCTVLFSVLFLSLIHI